MLQQLEGILVDVVERVIPSVVSVTTTKLQRISFYRVAPLQGQGSGVIISDDGYIITNAHVVKGAEKLEVTLHNGKSFEASVVGKSSIRDLAVLKIDSNGLTPIKVSNSKELKVGQFALAIGNPLGLGSTATLGVVSAIDRTIQTRKMFLEGLIQTSAQINPGNSGGALVNTNAELIGIPTAMIPWSQGIGFAISVEGVNAIYKELTETGTIRTPWMGIVGISLNAGMAAHYRLPIDKGALIVQVPKGPAYSAGIKQGDIIISIEDTEVESMESIRGVIVSKRVSSKINLKINRQNEIIEKTIELQEAPEV
ncbi:MAG: trypsin-like peptidase domain-containing protein [Candidatus Heimdallarchaeota archaeon]|nr:trypsin-like peptidase domain-containing protein [Candidatus Heimdallarchaeota archaeon]MCK4954692.1 trypsin-like peptidase domain-containing protein [Candidatus Heimdallarchaeota archaeon]